MLKVIIDGENFRHQVASALVGAGYIDQEANNDFFGFDLRGFFEAVLNESNLDIVYVTTKIKEPNYQIPEQLHKHLEQIRAANRKWVSYLMNQGVSVTKAGYLRVHESNACVHCGKRTMVLQEKGVDVRVATELILAVEQKQPVALVSSDSDLIPALQAAQHLGGVVSYVCPANRVNRSVVAESGSVVTFDDAQIIKYFEVTNE